MKICLLGTAHPSFNPRLVREADSLAEAGHDVRVIASNHLSWAGARDQALLQHRRWRVQTVDFRPNGANKLRAAVGRGRLRVASAVYQRLKSPALIPFAYGLAGPELLRIAKNESADWFVAHAHAALPAAAAAAAHWNARLGFDCEDLLAHAPGEPRELLHEIEASYLPRCDYVSTASPLMAEQLALDHRIPTPLVLYNVFPLKLAEGMLPPRDRTRNAAVRLHWFGQTIGPGRGLEDAVAALAQLPGAFELHLRGTPFAAYRERLEELAGSERHRLFFLPPLEHDELIRSMEAFDVGLALERPENANYSRTVTNKLFSYLLAGLAVAASATPGQTQVMSQVHKAGFLYPAGDLAALTSGLLRWLQDRQALRAAQQAAWNAARARFCWDLECEKFLTIFGAATSETRLPVARSVAR